MRLPARTTRRGRGERPAVFIGSGGDAIVGTFIPPMPVDRQMAVPVIPLARRLSSGDVLEHRLEIPAPYAETSAWLPDPAPQHYVGTDIDGVVLAINYWPANMAGLVATEVPYAPGVHAITSPNGGAIVSLRFPTKGLQFARRTDAFPRSMG